MSRSSHHTRIRLAEAEHSGRYTVLSVQTDSAIQAMLSRRGIEQGRALEVQYNNRQGTVVVEAGGMLIILGRACSFKIELLPQPKAVEPPQVVDLPDPIPLRVEAES